MKTYITYKEFKIIKHIFESSDNILNENLNEIDYDINLEHIKEGLALKTKAIFKLAMNKSKTILDKATKKSSVLKKAGKEKEAKVIISTAKKHSKEVLDKAKELVKQRQQHNNGRLATLRKKLEKRYRNPDTGKLVSRGKKEILQDKQDRIEYIYKHGGTGLSREAIAAGMEQ